jgi:tetratricopeptide (TPR) repeat protein
MNLGTVYFAADRLEDAETALKKVIELNPEAPLIRGFLGNVYLVQRRPKAALAEYNQESFQPLHLSGRVLALDALGDRAAADEALTEMQAEFGDDAAWSYAQIYTQRGDVDEAFQWLESAYEQKIFGLVGVKNNVWLRPLHADPRWQPFLEKMNLAG